MFLVRYATNLKEKFSVGDTNKLYVFTASIDKNIPISSLTVFIWKNS